MRSFILGAVVCLAAWLATSSASAQVYSYTTPYGGFSYGVTYPSYSYYTPYSTYYSPYVARRPYVYGYTPYSYGTTYSYPGYYGGWTTGYRSYYAPSVGWGVY